MMIDSCFTFSSIEEIKANTAWDLEAFPDVKVTPEPTAEEPEVLHAVDVTNVLKRK